MQFFLRRKGGGSFGGRGRGRGRGRIGGGVYMWLNNFHIYIDTATVCCHVLRDWSLSHTLTLNKFISKIQLCKSDYGKQNTKIPY